MFLHKSLRSKIAVPIDEKMFCCLWHFSLLKKVIEYEFYSWTLHVNHLASGASVLMHQNKTQSRFAKIYVSEEEYGGCCQARMQQHKWGSILLSGYTAHVTMSFFNV